MEELVQDMFQRPEGPERRTTIHAATGSGGAAAGLIRGNRLLDLNRRIVAVCVCDDRDNFLAGIGTICETAIATHGMAIPFERERDIDIGDDHVGQGSALSRPE